MDTQKYDYGMIGLGTMGRNLVFNMSTHGFSVAGFDTDAAKVDALQKENEGRKVFGAHTLEEFLGALSLPRVIMLLVPAGKPVDAVTEELKPFLQKEDLIIDCGNSHFTDTDQRIAKLLQDGIHFMGIGISGGEFGARFGPSIMPGGVKEVYDRIAPMLEAVSAKVNNEPCVTWLGPGSAGHYVKMVHNGIEYGLMQLISEAYYLLKECAGMNNDELHEVFTRWNEGMLQSFLIQITGEIFAKNDDLTSNRLVDMILDKAGQKGTGQWTSQSAMDLGLPIPAIDAAVSARDLSGLKEEREAAAKKLTIKSAPVTDDRKDLVQWLESALYFSMITTFAQGMSLLKKASVANNYGLKLDEVAKIWRGGCIIRAALLEDIRNAFSKNADLPNLMMDDTLATKLVSLQDNIRLAVQAGVRAGIPMPAMMASLAYYDGYRSAWLPANLVQAQRDYFGAHTYVRNDRDGIFHTQWEQKQN